MQPGLWLSDLGRIMELTQLQPVPVGLIYKGIAEILIDL